MSTITLTSQFLNPEVDNRIVAFYICQLYLQLLIGDLPNLDVLGRN